MARLDQVFVTSKMRTLYRWYALLQKLIVKDEKVGLLPHAWIVNRTTLLVGMNGKTEPTVVSIVAARSLMRYPGLRLGESVMYSSLLLRRRGSFLSYR